MSLGLRSAPHVFQEKLASDIGIDSCKVRDVEEFADVRMELYLVHARGWVRDEKFGHQSIRRANKTHENDLPFLEDLCCRDVAHIAAGTI